jgi:16S rRNA (cytidine1402-2'-O)-methyltransferase
MPSEAERPRRYFLMGHDIAAPALAPGLYLVATPIGHLKDISIRALETLAGAEAILCEDTRVTGKLAAHYGLKARLIAYHDHNAERVRPEALARLANGAALALVSDAGTPLISDPGYKLALDVSDAGLPVFAIPGASAVLTALSVAALPTDSFFFAGFLPPKSGARQTRLREVAAVPGTLVFYETGPRLCDALADMAVVLGDRPAAICRELTKLHEEVRRGTLAGLGAALAGQPDPKGEIVVVVGPPPPAAPIGADDLDALLRAALTRGTVKDAATDVAAATGLPKKDVYRRALELAAR